MHRRLAFGSLAALTAVGLGCGALGIGKAREPIAARVNGEVITVAELDAVAPRLKPPLAPEARRKAPGATPATADPHTDRGRPRVGLRPGGPARGPADAKVTVVEFSDFQCPFCQRAKPVLDEIATRHPNDVKIVYRHLPLDSLHPRARASAEAAACAAEGNKFWEFHDRLFANQRALGDADLREY